MANEKRLIDAKEGKKRFCAIAQPAEYKGVIHLVVPISEIDKLPTVDAVEVVHGRWERAEEFEFISGEYVTTGYHCDKCGCYYKKRSNYCPDCGATMDLKGE